MLERIALMDSAVIRGLLLAVVGLLGLVLSFFGIDEAAFGEKATRMVDAVMLLITAGGVFYAGYSRATKPNPPLTDAAVERTLLMQQKQGGLVRAAMLALLLGASIPAIAILPGCATVQGMSLEQRAKFALDTHTAVTRSIADAVDARQISSDTAQRYESIAKDSRALIESAIALSGSDVSTAEGQLQLANDILVRLQEYLDRQEA
jgi:hypothetical protein